MAGDSPTITQIAQVGVESTAGTIVAATKRLPNFMVNMDPDGSFSEYRSSGSIFIENVLPGEELTKGTTQGGMNFTDLVYALSSVVAYQAPTGSATAGYIWTFAPNPLGGDTYKTYTLEMGDSGNAYKFANTVWAGFGMKLNKKTATHSGELLGLQLDTNIMTGGVPAVTKQIITPKALELYSATTMAGLKFASTSWVVSLGSPSAGNFTLTYGGQTTANIVFNAAASAVASALNAISSIPGSAASVTGANGGPYTVTIALVDATPLTGSGAGLTGGTFAVSGASGATAATKVSRLFDIEFNIKNRFGPVFQMDASDQSFCTIVQLAPDVTAKIKLGAKINAAPTAWAIATAYAVGTVRRPTADNGFNYKVTSVAGTGTSHASTEPTWPTKLGATVIDNPGANQVVWTCVERDFSGPFSLAAMRAGTPLYLRIQGLGPTIPGTSPAIPYALYCDMCVVINKPLKLEDDQGVVAAGWECRVTNDTVAQYPFKFTIANDLASL